ncbi:hypothetical protein LTR16_006050, partial [Cryomyces antarcticus]
MLEDAWQLKSQDRAIERLIARTPDRPDIDERDFPSNGISTLTHAELEMQNILSRLSGTPMERMSRDTTLYQLGLDSISAVQVAAQLRKKGYTVSAADVIERPSSAELLPLLQSQGRPHTGEHSDFDFNAFKVRQISNVSQDL